MFSSTSKVKSDLHNDSKREAKEEVTVAVKSIGIFIHRPGTPDQIVLRINNTFDKSFVETAKHRFCLAVALDPYNAHLSMANDSDKKFINVELDTTFCEKSRNTLIEQLLEDAAYLGNFNQDPDMELTYKDKAAIYLENLHIQKSVMAELESEFEEFKKSPEQKEQIAEIIKLTIDIKQLFKASKIARSHGEKAHTYDYEMRLLSKRRELTRTTLLLRKSIALECLTQLERQPARNLSKPVMYNDFRKNLSPQNNSLKASRSRAQARVAQIETEISRFNAIPKIVLPPYAEYVLIEEKKESEPVAPILDEGRSSITNSMLSPMRAA